MTDQELIQALRCCENGESEDCPFAGHGVCGCPGMSADLIERLTAENAALRTQMPRWIPVTERLPELESWGASAVVLGLIKTKSTPSLNKLHNLTLCVYCDNGIWSVPGQYVAITHWMPLPAAPGEEPR